MTIKRRHANGGFIRIDFEDFFSKMSSAECRLVLNLLINAYGMSPSEIEKMFLAAIAKEKSTKRKIHLSNSYKIFRKEHTDGIVQGICPYKK